MADIVRANPDLMFLVKDSGVLLEGFYEEMMAATDFNDLAEKFLAALDTEAYLGVTRGGTSTNFENETRIIEYDGRRVRAVGDFVVDSATPQITAPLLVQNTTNLQRIMPMSDVTRNPITGTVAIRPRLGSPQASDYMDDLSLIKQMVNGDIQVMTLFKAINTASVTFTGDDKSESVVSCTFTGNARNWRDTEYAPVEINTWPANYTAPPVTP